jgi:hypothetical protein
MKTQHINLACDILREEDGEWVWCGHGETREDGGVILPQQVLDRATEGRFGKFEVEGESYWLKPSNEKPAAT